VCFLISLSVRSFFVIGCCAVSSVGRFPMEGFFWSGVDKAVVLGVFSRFVVLNINVTG